MTDFRMPDSFYEKPDEVWPCAECGEDTFNGAGELCDECALVDE